jgi:rod shape-determining protein MreD
VRTRRGVIAGLIALYLCAAFQETLAPRMRFAGVYPDLLLTVGICLSMLVSRTKAALCGFAAGLTQGAIVGAAMGAFIVTRTAAGFMASWSKTFGYEPKPVAIGVVTFFATLFASILWFFFGQGSGIAGFGLATIGTALYNGVLSIPLYALLRRVVDPPRR